jgi:uncharacterized coiled-coil protein SlyX
VAECQNLFGDKGVTKDVKRGQKLNEELRNLTKKLRQLEEEYFQRNS